MKVLIAYTGMYCHHALSFLIIKVQHAEFYRVENKIPKYQVILSLVNSVFSADSIGDVMNDPSFLGQVLSWLFATDYKNERIAKC